MNTMFLGQFSGGLLPVVLILSVAVSSVTGCKYRSGKTMGEQGVIQFTEPNSYPGDHFLSQSGFDEKIAVGSEVDIGVSRIHSAGDSPKLCTIGSGVTDDPSIIEVTDFGLTFLPGVVLRMEAKKAGTTRLHVSLTCLPLTYGEEEEELTDTVVLTTVEPDGIDLWFSSTGSEFIPHGPGYALRPDAELEVEASLYAGGELLIGFNILQWLADPELLDRGPDFLDEVPIFSKTLNTQTFTATGVSGFTEISTQLGGDNIEVQTLSVEDELELKIFGPNQEEGAIRLPTSPLLEIDHLSGSGNYFTLAAYSLEGRLVIPSRQDEIDLSYELIDGEIPDLEIGKMGDSHRLTGCPGSGTVRLTYVGHQIDLSVSIEPTDDQTDCE